MKLLQPVIVMLSASLFSNSILAGVYKCTDTAGNTSYQAAPCVETIKSHEINLQTGGVKDLLVEKKQKDKNKEKEVELLQKEELEKQKLIDIEAKRIKDSAEQTALNQLLIQDNPIQFSAFAIPPYAADNLTDFVKQFEARLPEIEKFRRIAAQKALATGNCGRVESDELSLKSKLNSFVFTVGCSSAKTFHFNEAELLK